MEVNAVEGVAVAALAKFLQVRNREVEDVVAIGGIVRGNVVVAFDGAFTFDFIACEVVIVVIIVVGGGQGCYGGRGAGGKRAGLAKFIPCHLLIVRSPKGITADSMDGNATVAVQIS